MLKTKTLFKAVCLSSLAFVLNVQAQTSTKGCAAKKDSVESQIAYAKKHGNTQELTGLETALSELNAHCTDERLRADREAKIKEKQEKIAEYQADLKELQATGNKKKITKKQKKIQEVQAELKEAQDELSQ